MRWIALLGLLQACALADLRPPALSSPSEAMRKRGRALLDEAAHAHGLSAFRRHQTLTVVATDDWSKSVLAGWLSWWEPDRQRLEHRMLSGSFTSQMTLLDGPERGVVLGIQGFKTYRVEAGQVRLTKDEERTRFYLPTLQYFSELPFRLLSATDVVYVGRARFGGRAFERVFVTWGGMEPSEAHDQYDVWIDAKTRRIASCRYTVREAMDSATGTIFFEDLRQVGGVWLPFVQTVVLEAHAELEEPPSKTWFHRLEVERAAFDEVSVEQLRPLQDVPSGDRKPARASVQ